jgi:hypothetical protein
MGRDNARVTGVAAAEPDAAAVMRTFGLGDRVLSMHPLKGAWSNRVYRLVTDRGEFAVKQLLNPWQDPRWAECQRTLGLPCGRTVDLLAGGQFISLSADN